MLNDIKDYITIACGASLLVACIVIYGLFASNQGLKKKIAVQEITIQDQKNILQMYQDKEETSIIELEKKDKELTDLKKKRRENDKIQQSPEAKKWSDEHLPTDVIKFMRGK